MVLVTDDKSGYDNHPLFTGWDREGRHASRRSPCVNVEPGAVIAHKPGPEALQVATQLARGTALVVVEYPTPLRLAGWAQATAALNLYTLETAELDPQLRDHLQVLAHYSYNSFPPGPDRVLARGVLTRIHPDGLLDRDVVLSALIAFDVYPSAQRVVARLIDDILP